MSTKRIRYAELTEETFALIAGRFRILAEPMRLRLLHTLGRDEMTVGQLVKTTGGGQANISKHLALMLDAGMVRRRKEGLNVYYRVSDETIFEICDLVCARIGEQLANQRSAIRKYPAR
jgi:DNA-binding transcriptional ArsR family regulator